MDGAHLQQIQESLIASGLPKELQDLANDAFANQHDNWLAVRRLSAKYRWTIRSMEGGKWQESIPGVDHTGCIDFAVDPLSPDEMKALGRPQPLRMRFHMTDDQAKWQAVNDDLVGSRFKTVFWRDGDTSNSPDGNKPLDMSTVPFAGAFTLPYVIMGMTYRDEKWPSGLHTKAEYFEQGGSVVRLSTPDETQSLGRSAYMFMPYYSQPSAWLDADSGRLFQIQQNGPNLDGTSHIEHMYKYEDYTQDPVAGPAFPRRFTDTMLEGEGSNMKGWEYTIELSDIKINGDLPPETFKAKGQ